MSESNRAYIVETVIGIFAVSENNEVLEFVEPPNRLDELVEFLISLEKGDITPYHEKLVSRLKDRGITAIVAEHYGAARAASSYGITPEISIGATPMLILRRALPELAVKHGLAKTPEEFFEKLHEIMLEYTRRKLRREAQKRDLLAVQAIRAIDDIDKTINLYVARLREWYSVHFPELDELVKDHGQYAKIVYEFRDRSKFSTENLVGFGLSEEEAEKIASAAKSSIGAELSDFDLDYILMLAGIIIDLYKLRETLDTYIDAIMKEVAPNICALVGSKLGARLLSLAGGLEKLAKLPASTIQVLGAEKALFRALKTGGKPPKHGIIFQHPTIHKSPRWQRGKVARFLAAKLAIAAKVDFFTGRYVGDKLLKEFEERVDEIKKLYPKPPPKPEKPKTFEKEKKKRGERRR
ncbi:MAG: C/D box methylation guide ribonucleoprotein complex aNOP56 subunit [Desulfurococcaceae archaeon]